MIRDEHSVVATSLAIPTPVYSVVDIDVLSIA